MRTKRKRESARASGDLLSPAFWAVMVVFVTCFTDACIYMSIHQWDKKGVSINITIEIAYREILESD